MRHFGQYLVLSLPDFSVVALDTLTLRFHRVSKKDSPRSLDEAGRDLVASSSKTFEPFPGACLRNLARRIERPSLPFSRCFRRTEGALCYSPRYSVYAFELMDLGRLYGFRGSYLTDRSSPSSTQWSFLDGGIVASAGYGTHSRGWISIRGAQALRAICLFFGVRQPVRIMEEGRRTSLALLLERMTAVPTALTVSNAAATDPRRLSALLNRLSPQPIRSKKPTSSDRRCNISKGAF